MLVLLGVAVAVYRGASSRIIIGLWLVGLVCTLLLFRYHVTSALDLSF